MSVYNASPNAVSTIENACHGSIKQNQDPSKPVPLYQTFKSNPSMNDRVDKFIFSLIKHIMQLTNKMCLWFCLHY